MLHAMGAIAACVCKDIFPTYWIYEKRTPKEPANPYTLIEAARLLYKLELDDLRNSSFESIVLNLMPDGTDMGSTDSREVSKFFLLLDEITCLYIPIKGHESSEEISRRDTCCFVLGQLREIARKGDVIIMATASKVNIADYVFHPDSVRSGVSMYPDFNCGLFTISQIRPPRTIALLKEYCCARYKENFTTDLVTEIFYYTGGIGRFVDCYKTEENKRTNFDGSYLLSDPKLFHLSCSLLSTPTIGLASLKAFGIDMCSLNHWVDTMIFYCDNSKIEFLTPQIADIVKEFLSNNHIYELIHVFNRTRHGFHGGSPGHSNEELLSLIAPAVLKLEGYMEPQREIAFIKSDTDVRLYLDGNHFGEDICGLCNRLLRWNIEGIEIGIDRIWFEFTGGVLYVSGAQIKSGKDTKQITAGVLETQRRKPTQRVDDTTIAGILVKAERGFDALLSHLAQVFQGPIQIKELVILTNKDARDGFEKFWIANAATMPEERFVTASVNHFYCTLHDGMSWIIDNITVEASSLLL